MTEPMSWQPTNVMWTVVCKDGSTVELEAYSADEAKRRAEKNLRLKVAGVKPWSGGVCSVRLD